MQRNINNLNQTFEIINFHPILILKKILKQYNRHFFKKKLSWQHHIKEPKLKIKKKLKLTEQLTPQSFLRLHSDIHETGQ